MKTLDRLPIQYDLAPENLRGGLERWIEHGIEPGSFLTAFLSNDLMRSLAMADETNRTQLHALGLWLYNHAPALCFGSPERVEGWIKMHQEGKTEAS